MNETTKRVQEEVTEGLFRVEKDARLMKAIAW
jgi:hypothetical protein